MTNWSDWEIYTLQIVVRYNLYSPSMEFDKLKTFPLLACKFTFMEHWVSTLNTINQRVHQDIDFEYICNIWIKTFLFQSQIYSVETQILNVNIFLPKYFINELLKDNNHSVFHYSLIETKSHSTHNIHINLSFQQRCKQGNNLTLEFSNSIQIFISIKSQMFNFTWSLKASNILSATIKNFWIDKSLLI